MKISTPSGGGLYYSNKFTSQLTISAITNEKEPTVSVNADTGSLKAGDIVLFDTPGWEHITSSIYEVKAKTNARSFVIKRLDTTNTDWFTPNGARGGFVSTVTDWTEVPQVLTYERTGGETKWIDVEFLFRLAGVSIPSGRDPIKISITMAHSAQVETFYTLQALSMLNAKVALKCTGSDGGSEYCYGTLSFLNSPTRVSGSVNTVMMNIAPLGMTTFTGGK